MERILITTTANLCVFLKGRFGHRCAAHKGTHTSEMVTAMNKLGVSCSRIHSSEILGYPISKYAHFSETKIAEKIKYHGYAFIKKQIDAEQPLITTVKHGSKGIGHFVCVIGYDKRGSSIFIYVRDPLEPPGSEPKEFLLGDFMKYWIYQYKGKLKLEAVVLGVLDQK